MALKNPGVDPDLIVESFLAYVANDDTQITRQEFKANLEAKLRDRNFVSDIGPLLAPGFNWDVDAMAISVHETLIKRLPE